MNNLLTNDDQTLWESFINGSNDAFEKIYFDYSKMLISYGYRICSDREMVTDCVQQLFTNLLERRNFLGTTNTIKFYLFKSLRSIILKELKSAQKIEWEQQQIDFEEMQSSIESKLIFEEKDEEFKQKLKIALDKITPREREILYLKYYSGLSHQEIATLLSINYQSVKNTTSRAIHKLKQEMHVSKTASVILIFSLFL